MSYIEEDIESLREDVKDLQSSVADLETDIQDLTDSVRKLFLMLSQLTIIPRDAVITELGDVE